MLEEAGTLTYSALIDNTKGLKASTAWLMRTGLLTQFSLAVQEA